MLRNPPVIPRHSTNDMGHGSQTFLLFTALLVWKIDVLGPSRVLYHFRLPMGAVMTGNSPRFAMTSRSKTAVDLDELTDRFQSGAWVNDSPWETEIDVDTLVVTKREEVKEMFRPSSEHSEELTPPIGNRRRRQLSFDQEKGLPFHHVEQYSHNYHGSQSLKSLMDDERSRAVTLHGANRYDALILGMERTFFAALNNAWLLVIAGIGLMSVGNNVDQAVTAGGFIMASGLACAVVAFVLHIKRLSLVRREAAFPVYHSAVWVSLIVALTVIALVLELKFGFEHPYLERAAAVTLKNETGSQKN